MSLALTTLCAGLRYGYSLYYWAKIEGIPTLLGEVGSTAGATAPSGYTIDPSLVIDRSAAAGVLVGKEHVGAGFDFTLRLLDTAAVRSLFTRPTAVTWLTSELTATATTASVAAAGAFAASGTLHVGSSAIPYSSKTESSFTSLTRGSYGTAKRYGPGTLVYNGPRYWRGRKLTVYVTAVDPMGRYVQGADVLVTSAVLFEGHIVTRPVRDGSEWTLDARAVDRRLTDPLTPAASGKAVWQLNSDQLLRIDPLTSVFMKVWERTVSSDTNTTIEEVSFRPFEGVVASGDGNYYARLSEIRAMVKDAYEAAVTSGQLNDMIWIEEDDGEEGARRRVQRAHVEVRVTSGVDFVFLDTRVESAINMLTQRASSRISRLPYAIVGSSEWGRLPTPLRTIGQVMTGSLAVILEEGDPAELPTAGYVELELDGSTAVYEYTSLQIDDADPSRVHLALASSTPPPLQLIAQQDRDGELGEVSVSFLWRDAGTIPDIMRRMLQSSGTTSALGTYDTLPAGQGYALEDVDESSFDTVFDGAFLGLSAAIAVDQDVSFVDLFGGLLRLADRAIISRPAADGSALELTAIRTGPPDTAEYVAEITDAMLVSARPGQRPVRVLTRKDDPYAIEIELHQRGQEQGPLNFINGEGPEFGRERWSLDVHGIDRSALIAPGAAWARQRFLSAETEQVLEIDVPGWVPGYAGDVVRLNLTDAQLWTYSSGVPGFVGLARIDGHQFHLKAAVKTLRVRCDGAAARYPLSPAAPIVDYAGTSTAPTSLTLPRDYYGVMAAFLASSSPFELRCFLPGDDHDRDGFDIDGVSDTGSACVLTVDAVLGSPDLDLVVYSEDFASGFGVWRQDYSHDSDWTRLSGSTPTSLTGPTAAPSGFTYYIYTEATSHTSETFIVNGPVVDCGPYQGKLELRFQRHMHGADMGSLYVEFDRGEGAGWETVWSQSGPQGNQWDVITVDISDYAGDRVAWRIRGVTGITAYSDMAVADIQIVATPHRLTPPVLADCNDAQAAYLHTTSGGQWG